MIKKTYIPGKPRNPKLTQTTGASGISKTEFNNVAGSSHEHYNKGVLDQITEAMLISALRELITSTDTTSELTDENILSALRVLSEISKANVDLLNEIKSKFLSKIEPDTAQKLIKYVEGLEIGNYTSGLLGSGAKFKMNEGVSELEVDKLSVRMRAEFLSVLIHNAKHIGGELVISAANMICNKVEEFSSFYRCYFDRGENNEVNNLFTNQDRAQCQVFTGSGQKFYWRKVLAVGSDYIELSKTDASPGSNDIPEVGDHISQLGSDDPERQSAMIFSTVGIDAPSFKQYAGINSFSLGEEKIVTKFTRLGNRIQGKTVFTSGGSNLDDYLDETAQDIQDAQAAANAAALKAQQAIDDAAANVTDYNAKFATVQAQIDGEVSNWFYAYSPTLANYPASEWTTNAIKDRHIGDTFTNTQQAPATDAGKSWRFVKNASVYSWTLIADSDAVLALQKAALAQSTADGKSTTYLIQPTKYKLGDMWVLNADQTVNGIAYKSGEILTATQDSETFVQAHWVKRVRYTDDSAVNNLEIGGRNYAVGSKYPHNLYLGSYSRELVDGIGRYEAWGLNGTIVRHVSLEIPNLPMGEYTFSIKGRLETKAFNNTVIRGGNVTNGSLWSILQISDDLHVGTVTINKNTTEDTLLEIILYQNRESQTSTEDAGVIWIDWYKLEKGNKATDWTEAPEDVEARINSAKQEAENSAKAYADAKSEAERVIAEAYADGKVSAEEQARIDDVNAKLAAAKAYAEAQDALLKTQQEAYADGAISTAEQAAINAAKDYADLKKTEAQAYADGIVSDEEARAIADALDKFNASKAHAEQLVKDIEIGGRNLLINSKIPTSANTAFADPIKGQVRLTTSDPTYWINRYSVPLSAGEVVTFSISCRRISGSGNISMYLNSNNGYVPLGTVGTEWVTLKLTRTINVGVALGDILHINGVTADGLLIEWAKLERGNKATDWTEAREDTDKKISDVDAKAIEALAKANISKAITDKFGTTIDGGLINTVTVELREADTQDVTAGHTGIQGSLKNLPAYWAGGTYAEALAGIAGIILRHDGTGKIGVFEVDEAGSVNIYDPVITDLLRLEFIKSKVPTVESLMSQTQAGDSVTNVARMFYSSSGSATLPNSVTVTEEGAELSFQGMMELDVTFDERDGATSGSAAVGVYLYKDGSNYATLGGISAGRIDRDNPYFSSFVQLSKKLTVPKGVYTIVVSGSFNNALGSAGINNTSTLSWILRRDIRRFIFGSDGFASWYTENSFHFSELTGMFARGKVDIPAGLGGGSSSAGGTSGRWGMVTGATRSSSTTTINHSIGDLKYTVMVTPSGSSATWYMQNKTVNSVQIISSGAFDYILVRTPY